METLIILLSIQVAFKVIGYLIAALYILVKIFAIILKNRDLAKYEREMAKKRELKK